MLTFYIKTNNIKNSFEQAKATIPVSVLKRLFCTNLSTKRYLTTIHYKGEARNLKKSPYR